MKIFNKIIKYLFFGVIVKTVVLFIMGLNVRNRHLIPRSGPAIIVANHNSHLDTMVLAELLGLKRLKYFAPVAAADYFLKGKLMSWFSREIIGIIPISRSGNTGIDPLLPCYEALEQNKILVIYPEGSRGEPEVMTKLKKGVAYISEKYPEIPIVPVFTYGLGKSLPKGDPILVPFFCDIFVGESIYWNGSKENLIDAIENSFNELSKNVIRK